MTLTLEDAKKTWADETGSDPDEADAIIMANKDDWEELNESLRPLALAASGYYYSALERPQVDGRLVLTQYRAHLALRRVLVMLRCAYGTPTGFEDNPDGLARDIQGNFIDLVDHPADALRAILTKQQVDPSPYVWTVLSAMSSDEEAVARVFEVTRSSVENPFLEAYDWQPLNDGDYLVWVCGRG